MAPVLLLVIVTVAAAAQPRQTSRPPRELHRVGDHWTAYNPPDPSTYPPEAKTHTIARGDTLWALAQRYYGNAYLWPQLWESNTWITDAHWIYPGDVLLLEGEATASADADADADTGTTTGDPEVASGTGMGDDDQEGGDTLPTVNIPAANAPNPIPLATEADLYCFGYVGDPDEPMPNHIESFEDHELLHQPGVVRHDLGVGTDTLVFVNGGTSTGIIAGETYLLVEPGHIVRHPSNKSVVGREWEYRGQVRILCAEETRSRGIIIQACDDIHLGARLKPLPQLPIPIARIPDLPTFCDPPSGKQSGVIVDSQDRIYALGVGDLVHIDLGRDDQLQPGDFLTVTRESPIAGQPRQVLGEIGILTTESRTATAKIVAMRYSIGVGDRVEVK